ncbi:hypothetical protein ACGFIY_33020 [Micromonospora chersina]|uniref:hypothetical protein n=1 Tax=Micromonospora chersina TaxID=47854 RepID=UPI0037122CAB
MSGDRNVLAEALFASDLQQTDDAPSEVVRAAVADSLGRHGVRGCEACVAVEYGDHPETAVPRMRWAVSRVRAVYFPVQTTAAA